jgi:hypothetical protein
MFVFGLIVGLVAGGVAVAAYLNNIHSAKVKGYEDKIAALTNSVKSALKS